MTFRNYQDYPLTLLAGVPQELAVSGTYWQIVTAASPIQLVFDESRRVTRPAGSGGPSSYSRVRVTSAVDQAVVISLGFIDGVAPYDRTSSTFSGTVNVAANNPVATQSLDDVSIPANSQLLVDAATANRIGLTVQLISYAGPDLSTYNGFRIGDSTVSATRGARISEGVVWGGSAGVYVYNPNPFAIVVSRQRETV